MLYKTILAYNRYGIPSYFPRTGADSLVKASLIGWLLISSVILSTVGDMIFNNHITLPSKLIISIYSLVDNITRSPSTPDTISKLHCKEKEIHWSKPSQGTWKLNTDGSVRDRIRKATCGGLIRDWEGKLIKAFYHNFPFCSPMHAEP